MRAPSGKYGENHGDPVHFRSHQTSEMQIGDHALGRARASQCLSVPMIRQDWNGSPSKLLSTL
jgi:hypothetical protein